MEKEENAPLKMKVTGVLRKFKAKPDGSSWSNEEIESGLADDYLYETVTFEDDLVTEIWRKDS